MASSVTDVAAAAAATAWVDRAGNQVQRLSGNAARQGAAVWLGFTGWYSADQVAERAAEAAAVSEQAQTAVTQLMAQYVAELTAALKGSQQIHVPTIATASVRNGADPIVVHSRAAKAYRIDYAQSQDTAAALQAAFDREMGLIEADLVLAARQAQQDAMQDLAVTHYRRVLRPELSKTGSCGLCLAASLKVYKTGDLMPIHVPSCKCLTMPIIDGQDPAAGLNDADRQDAYEAAGATGKSALSNVRVQIHHHGEYGPVLTVAGQKFTGPDDLAKTA